MRKPYSLTRRLLFSATVLLVVFLGIAGLSLDVLYQKRATDSLQNELLGHVYTLLSASKDDEKGLPVLAQLMPDPRLNQTDSGLYATVIAHQNGYRWSSASLLGQQLELYKQIAPGQKSHQNDGRLMTLYFGVAWEDYQGTPHNYTYSVATTLELFKQNLNSYRRELAKWLGGSTLILILVQLVLLRWGLRPLQQAAAEIKNIESGQQDQLRGDYPAELQGLTGNINSLIRHVSANQQRYRKSLGDLAHSLKTPLTLIQAARYSSDSELGQTLDDQLPRIDDLVQYQLQRASVMGKNSVAQSIELLPVIEKITRSLGKVYHDKHIQFETLVETGMQFRGDEADLMELLGNLVDNACKYGKKRVRISARQEARLVLVVEDDGAGIRPEDKNRLLQRGFRADQQQPGQGIGLDIVKEITDLYNAQILITNSELGGASLQILFN